MLRLLMGRAGTGKSQEIMEEIVASPGEQACLIVPEQASHMTERSLCRQGGDGVSRYAEVLSFTRLSARVFAQAGGGAAPELDAGGRMLLMHRAVQSVAGELTVYAQPSRKPEFLRQLLATSDELKSCCISPDALAEAAQQAGREGEKLRDLALICGAYDALAAQWGSDPRDRLTRLCDALGRCDWGTGMRFYLDGFVDFTPQEREVLRILLRRAKSVTVALTCEELEKEDPSGVFSAAQRTGRILRAMAAECAVAVEERVLPAQKREGPLALLERGLFDQEVREQGQAGEQVRLFHARDERGEAEWVASEILHLTREKGYRFREIAVAARSFESCGDVVESVFRRYGIPLFRSVRTPVLQKPVAALVTAALDAAAGGYGYDDMFRYLKTGLTPIGQDDCDRLENYVLKWDLRGSRWTQEKPWNMHPGGYGLKWTDRDKAEVAHLDQVRRQVAEPLENLKKNKDLTGKGQALALYAFLEEIRLPERLAQRAKQLQQEGELNLAEEYRQIWDILTGGLEQCAQLLREVPITLEEFAPLLKLVLSQYDVGSIPVSLDRVTAGDLTRVTDHGLKALFLLNAHDGAIPQVATAAGLLSDEDRSLLSSLGLEAASRLDDRLEREMTILYTACSCPREYLAMSWSDGGGGQQPCFLERRLKLLLSDLKTIEEESLKGAFRLTAPLPALEQAGGNERVRNALLQVEEYREAAKRLANAENWQRGSMSAEAAEKLYGKQVPMSASRMDKYKSCHFSYFLQYGLKARPRKPAGFQAPEYGTFVHTVLERVFRAVGKEGGAQKVSDQKLRDLTDEAIEYYVNSELGGLKEETPRFRYLFRRLSRTVWAVVHNMAEELRASEFRPIAFELGFGGDGELPPVEITQNGVTISITGFVDRVDGWEKDGKLYLRVVDYKTGRKSFDLTEVWNGLGLQMLLYLFTLEEKGKGLFKKDIVPTGVLYLPAREAVISGSRYMDEEELRKQVDSELKRKGVVLEDGDVLKAMERFTGQPRFLPVRVAAKTGAISGDSLVSAQRLGKLQKHIQGVLENICGELAQGNIAADPYWRGPEKNACQYCDYASACHFEEGRGGDRRRWLSKMNSKTFWSEVDKIGTPAAQQAPAAVPATQPGAAAAPQAAANSVAGPVLGTAGNTGTNTNKTASKGKGGN